MTKISASTAKVQRSDLRAIRTSQISKLDPKTKLFVEMHDEKGTVRRVISHDVPEGSLESWPQAGVVRVQGRGEVAFGNHDMPASPPFPVFFRPKLRGEGLTHERMTFLIPATKEINDSEAKPKTISCDEMKNRLIKKVKEAAPAPEEAPRRRGRPVGSKDSKPRARRSKTEA